MIPPELHTYLDSLRERIEGALGPTLQAVYLTGSAAAEAFRAGSSDVDVLVVAEGADRSRLDAIVTSCAHEALPCPAEKLELVVYEKAALATPAAVPDWSLNFNTGAAVRHVGLSPASEPAHWFVLDLAYARRHAVALYGPPPAELIGPIPDEAVAAAFDAQVAWYGQHEPSSAALAAARAAHWRATGEFSSKADAAAKMSGPG